jgi:hypothetical protein
MQLFRQFRYAIIQGFHPSEQIAKHLLFTNCEFIADAFGCKVHRDGGGDHCRMHSMLPETGAIT